MLKSLERTGVIKPSSYVLASIRKFPSLEPIRVQPVANSVLGLPVRRDLLWSAVVYEQDIKRIQTKHVKTRGEMGYSRKKLRPQKGSGKARMGDRGNPIRHDGGRAFGRLPGFDYWSTELPAKVYAKAFRTALSHQYDQGKLFVVDGEAEFVTNHEFAGEEFMKKHGIYNNKVTFLVDQFRFNLHDATHRFKNVEIISKEAVEVSDILRADRLIVEDKVLQYLAEQYREPGELKAIRPKQSIEEIAAEV